MADYAPVLPYGSRWNYRTPSPPPPSVIEPISPLHMPSEGSVSLPDSVESLPAGRAIIDTTPSRLQSHEELRSDSTLSLLSSVSSPTPSSRRLSPNHRGSFHDRRNVPDVPTFAGNQYFDPLAFFADVALSSADPTTLPKLQQLAAKDAAQRLEAAPTGITTSGEDTRRKPTWDTRGFLRRPQAAVYTASDNTKISGRDNVVIAREDPQRSTSSTLNSSRPSERIELPPLRDLTPPSSNNSDAGPSAIIAEALHSSFPHTSLTRNGAVDAAVFSSSPSKRTKREPAPNTEDASTEASSIERAVASMETMTRNVKGKKSRAKPPHNPPQSTMAVNVETTTNTKSKASKSKKAKISTPNIAVRRSTRKIKFINGPDEELSTPLHKPLDGVEGSSPRQSQTKDSISDLPPDTAQSSGPRSNATHRNVPVNEDEDASAIAEDTHNAVRKQEEAQLEPLMPSTPALNHTENKGIDNAIATVRSSASVNSSNVTSHHNAMTSAPKSTKGDKTPRGPASGETTDNTMNDGLTLSQSPEEGLKERLTKFVADWGAGSSIERPSRAPSTINNTHTSIYLEKHPAPASLPPSNRELSVDSQAIVDMSQRGPIVAESSPPEGHEAISSPGRAQVSSASRLIASVAPEEDAESVDISPSLNSGVQIDANRSEMGEGNAPAPNQTSPTNINPQPITVSLQERLPEAEKSMGVLSVAEVIPKLEAEETVVLNDIASPDPGPLSVTVSMEFLKESTLHTGNAVNNENNVISDAGLHHTSSEGTDGSINRDLVLSEADAPIQASQSSQLDSEISEDSRLAALDDAAGTALDGPLTRERTNEHQCKEATIGTQTMSSQNPLDTTGPTSGNNLAPTNTSLDPVVARSRTQSGRHTEDTVMSDAPIMEVEAGNESSTSPAHGGSDHDGAQVEDHTHMEGLNARSPSTSDICLICKSSAILNHPMESHGSTDHNDATPVANLNTPWIQCDGCKLWTHTACVNLSNEDVDGIDKYHCPQCEMDKGPSTYVRKSSRPKVAIDYESLNNGSAVPAQSATNKLYHPYVDKILSGEFKTVKENFPRVVPEELSIQFFEDGAGFRLPVVIPAAINPYPRNSGINQDSDGFPTPTPNTALPAPQKPLDTPPIKDGIETDRLGMGFPNDLTIRKVVELVGPEELVEVIDVKSQQGDKRKWPLSKWVEYFEDPNRDRIYNVLSLEVSQSKLGRMIQRPAIVREMDLSDQVWPKDKMKEFPNVQYYCLMSVAHAYTDWHVDFGGSSVYYRILKGKKVFFFMKPTRENLDAYQRWTMSPEQSWTWLAEGRECFRIDLGPGDTMLIPSGWLHAVYTPEDSLVIGGNFLTRLHYNMQFQVHEIEKANNTPLKYKFPRFARVHWYDAIKLLEEDPIPPQVDQQLLEGKAANFPAPKGKGNTTHLSEWVLDGLPAFTQFLRRNSLIAQEVITEGLTKQKADAVRGAIPKGYNDGWEIVQKFARWATWKRNAGEVIPSWAYPDADPADGVPNAGQKKLSAAAIKHAERAKADAERRALGVVRPGLRERNVSSQFSPSVSNTPAPEEPRMKKRARQSTGDAGPARKKGRGQKEKLDQAVIDECVKEVIADYEASTDIFKQAMAVEVQTQYRNVHITRLGPSRSACAPCRDGKTKCVHKDEIKALISSVMDHYHTVKGTSPQDRKKAHEDFFGRSPDPEDRGLDSTQRHSFDGDDARMTPMPQFDASKGTPVPQPVDGSPNLVKKAPHNKPFITPRSKRLSKGEATEPRRRGGKRTACDACRKSRRKCLHGIPVDSPNGLAPPGKPIEAQDENNDLEHALSDAEEGSEIEDRGRGSSTLSPPPPHESEPAAILEMSPLTPGLESPRSSSRYTTPIERIIHTDSINPASQQQSKVAVPKTESDLPSTFAATVSEDAIIPGKLQSSTTIPEARSSDVSVDGRAEVVVGSSRPFSQITRTKRRRGAEMTESSPDHTLHQMSPSPSSVKRARPVAPQFEGDESSPPKRAKRDSEGSGSFMSPPRSIASSKLRTTPRRTPMAHASAEQWISPGNEPQNSPEKLAWQENKAAEFGLRNRSKSKS